MSPPSINQPFVTGVIETAAGKIPVVSRVITLKDRLGSMKVRCGIGRSSYRVDPGLYALGNPDSESEILVTANYKLTFDTLRACVGERSFWLLVLDTHGVNVWCAAGKGTFGTDQLVSRIGSSRLHLLVRHRRLIVPQLAAPGISAWEVKKMSGFKVIFGPVECLDLAEFMDNGLVASRSMRFKNFGLADRATLIPVELLHSMKIGVCFSFLSLILGGFLGQNHFFENAVKYGGVMSAAIFIGIFSGAVLGPLLLPWLPSRSFAAKGAVIGMITPMTILALTKGFLDSTWSLWEAGTIFMVSMAAASCLTMNFTGSSVFTSLSGVRKEMKWAIPFQIVVLACGLVAWAVSFLAE